MNVKEDTTMVKNKSMQDLLYMHPQYFFKYLREHFTMRHIVNGDQMHIQSVKHTAKNMNGLTYDLIGLERWYLMKKCFPCTCYRLKLNNSPFLSYYFLIFQNRFNGYYYYFDCIDGFHQYESHFKELLLWFIYDRYRRYQNVEENEYELYEFDHLISGNYEEEMIDLYLQLHGTKKSIYIPEDIKLEDKIHESKFIMTRDIKK